MKIYAIRHTSVNVKPGICYGQADVDVAESFSEEQKHLLQELERLSFDAVWSSPLLRCRPKVFSRIGKSILIRV